jgi:magnesium transporter
MQESEENYHPKACGIVATKKVPVCSPHDLVGDVIKKLTVEKPGEYDWINYIYVLNSEKKLKGTLTIEKIYRSDHKQKVSEIMNTNLVSVRAHSPQERAALLAIEHDLRAIPVTDKDDNFLGIITSEAILNILHKEHVEDILHLSGLGRYRNFDKDYYSLPIVKQILARLPWLVIGLIGGIIAASIVSGFNKYIEELVLLAAFLPAVVYIGDATGSQTQTLMVRNLGLNLKQPFIKYLEKELLISVLIGLFIGALAGLVSQIFWNNFTLALIIFVSFLLTIMVSAVVGVVLPFLFQKFKIDPAIGSGPIATVIRDLLSILVYFSVAMLFLT